jgi:tight adherence protein C
MTSLELLGLGVLAATGGFVAALSLRPSPPSDVELVQTRLRNYASATNAAAPPPPSLEELELQVPFGERVIRPQLARLAKALARATPDQTRQGLQRKLNLAGRPYGLEATEFTVVRYFFTGLMALIGLALGHQIGGAWLLLLGVGGGLFGFFFPALWLWQLVTTRRNEIEYTLPNAIDLLSVSVEAGLSFESAMATVAEKLEGPLATEFMQALQEIRLGRPRLEALDDLGRRVGVEEVHNLVQAIIQSAQLGTPISQILTLQADEIRRRRRQHAQEMGARAPLKMLIPMITCIFPTLWVMLLGPALLLVLTQCGASR